MYVIQGDDIYSVKEAKQRLMTKYKVDDFNYSEFVDNIEIGELRTALMQSPMMADKYTVYVELNKKQWVRLKEYLVPSKETVLIVRLIDFRLTSELEEGVNIKERIDCFQLKAKELGQWVVKRARELGFHMDIEDRRYLLSMFSTKSELDGVLTQLSLLSDFDRQVYLKELFNVKDRFVWDMFVILVLKKKREFFQKLAEQYQQNLDLDKSQFILKLVGGLLYCLTNWENGPSWIIERIDESLQFQANIVPFLYCELSDIATEAKKDTGMVISLNMFNALFENFKAIRTR